ncbi:sigma factor [Micromonospora sp. NPDC047670]|uniref:sigma factor n=1 Tax=Micromonospora sp. NPDC047670 TaxID=3364252 RepID=UPI0037179D8E
MPDASEQEYVEYLGARLPMLHRLAYSLCGNSDQADDLVQEAAARRPSSWPTPSGAAG